MLVTVGKFLTKHSGLVGLLYVLTILPVFGVFTAMINEPNTLINYMALIVAMLYFAPGALAMWASTVLVENTAETSTNTKETTNESI